jgi:NAD(P)-dependent dehydrogenase (short-subunit alcohol dehydrogenase family)
MKGGLNVLTRYMAKEFSPRGIRVNAVSPGATRTRLGDDAITRSPEVIPALAAKTAFGRVGEPGDIGAMICRTGLRGEPLGHRAEHRGVGRLQPLDAIPVI